MQMLSDTWKGLKYAKYVIFHPFNGFWEIKKQKRANVLSSTILLLALIIIFILRRQFTGFVINNNDLRTMNVWIQITIVITPFILWCTANWSVTTLMDGEGSFKDIYITTAYALIPIILFNVPLLILSNTLVLEEMTIYHLVDTISIIWSIFLMLVGIMTIHQFTMSKTIGTIIVALVGMVAILTLILLFFSLMQQIVNFGQLIYFELFQRT